MKRKPAASTRVPGYPNASEIARDRRGFLRLCGTIFAGVVATGSLARTVWADDKPKPRMKGDVAAPQPPILGGAVAPPADPPEPTCDPKKGDCPEKDLPRPPGTCLPPEPPVEIRKAGEIKAPEPPTRTK